MNEAGSQMKVLWRGSTTQRIRLASGLILFVFAATHFLNHALGLVSLDAMIAFDGWRVAVIRSVPGTLVLLAAFLAHMILSIMKLSRRRTLRMPAWEAGQIALGLMIPVLLVPHIVNTRVSAVLFGINTTYPYELLRIWPSAIDIQTVLMLVVWIHGCIGVHFWLRLSSFYQRTTPVLLALAVLLPFAAFTGISVQGRAISSAIAEPKSFAAFKADTKWPDPATQTRITTLRDRAQIATLALILVILAGIALRLLLQRRARNLLVRYVAGPQVKTQAGPTLLEISRANGIPHMSVCGGRGRCSTCRVLVMTAQSGLSPPGPAELATLRAIKAGPGIRLACQARPLVDVTVMPLLRVGAAPNPVHPLTQQLTHDDSSGVEQDLAVLFVDMRGFTALTERKLPFDVVFILNRFFATVGQPVYDMGGWISNYAGDGMIALFSGESGLDAACRAALLAASRIDEAVASLNAEIADELQSPIGIAMGLHAGPHVMGRVGYRESQSLSVIGLAMNVASRLEAMAKAAGVQIALSAEVAACAGLDVTDFHTEQREVRGLNEAIPVVFIPKARDIALKLRTPLAA
ncbi:adenylate/guanylate cyclase domain-containing protein [Lichenifustis flavocetrariae]|uniref:Adenylate/guanylate cyclase domain-containing protein n=1 Tax=Lichenifustis flavocetrariae TaxID=2949735 RepID=A0AA42CN88_9HYPH|nr:adenylate/guanylate cyclase domain-containing protein [Lichenifustis flavocetrariae]MCW6509167.1 adenylate/guanylate cyclase domain-containing protein [Lichenifustis flavocetrariae]